MRSAVRAWKLMSGPGATGQRKKGVRRARAATTTSITGSPGGRISSGFSRRSETVTRKARRAARRKPSRPAPGSHHHDTIQKETDRKGTAVQGARTISAPGRSRRAARAISPGASARTSGGTRADCMPRFLLPLPSGYDSRVSDPSSWLLALAGAVTGLVGSLLGIGGGAFLVPLLTLFFGIPIRAAIAASLISVIATASASATVNLDRGLVNLRLGLVLGVATSVGGPAGGVLPNPPSPPPPLP